MTVLLGPTPCQGCRRPVEVVRDDWRIVVRSLNTGRKHHCQGDVWPAEDEERYCRRCEESWPLDDGFWRVQRLSKAGAPIWECLACHREQTRSYYERRRSA